MRRILISICLLLSLSALASAEVPEMPADRQPLAAEPLAADSTLVVDGEVLLALPDEEDSLPPTEVRADDYGYDDNGKVAFNPSPTRAVWLSVLCPGLGQIYNRRYWKLPIVVGGFMGLGYATSWNNRQYQDYLQGYLDLVDNDPLTKSYMHFFAPTVNEDDLDHEWLTRVFKARKDSARRYRDLCIIGMVGFYGLCILDAYVDAQLTHFSVSEDLSIDWAPALLPQNEFTRRPAIGLQWALTF